METSVLIPDGENDLSFKVLTCLAQIAATRIHVLSSKQDPRARFSRFCASFHFRDSDSDEEWLEQIEKIVLEKGIDVVLPVFEQGTRLACVWRERLARIAALPVLPELATFDLAADKGSLFALLEKHNLPQPRTALLSTVLEHGLKGFRLPLLIKPRRSNDGVGITLCEDGKSVEEFGDSHRDEVDEYIVQDFTDGADVSCSVLCKDGKLLAHTVHTPIVAHERPYAASLCIRHIHHAHTIVTAKKLLSLLNWSGVANIDFRYNARSRRAEVLEINPRFSGNVVGSLTAGINFPHLACLTAINARLPAPRYRLRNYMEIRDAIGIMMRKLKGDGGVFPNFGETNLPFILRDPVPFLNRSIQRNQPNDEKLGGAACVGLLSFLTALDGFSA